jgi:hypothetical protein
MIWWIISKNKVVAHFFQAIELEAEALPITR